ncbi:Peroxisome biosynthesis protein pex1 [Nowakowskiella sp. JEL0078]|nr:Peroxisome biosynthesis protein pex1 [Nowakowskiella sp. JEL0078]
MKTRIGKRFLMAALGQSEGGVLICGDRGTGKTTLLNHIKSNAAKKDFYTHTEFINCRELSFEKSSNAGLKIFLKQILDSAVYHSPSIMMFDDFDLLFPTPDENQQHQANSSIGLMQVFYEFIKQIKLHHGTRIMFLASANHIEKIHPSIRLLHIFSHIETISPLDRDQRKKIISSIMLNSSSQIIRESLPSLDLLQLSRITDECTPATLASLVERAAHAASFRTFESKASDLRSAKISIDDFTKSMYKEKSMSSDVAIGWENIGGLKEVKKILLETLDWPSKYQELFKACPLRLRSGLLLYGYPGCGKTMLASAVAKECGVNFISVKGPELLNKYIGSSEKAVRDLFERAQAAKPCILFFDEFDAIAPRRGNDNTGVTDRVVNQMLTQMDGAEGLSGVYVLAATSRPDLIDSALLRPGRLDKSILCDMPSQSDRLEILRASCQPLQLSTDAKEFIEQISSDTFTNGFSGADCQALIYNANLLAIHTLLEDKNTYSNIKTEKQRSISMVGSHEVQNSNELVDTYQRAQRDDSLTTKNFEKAKKSPTVTKDHLLSAIRNTSSSNTEGEINRLKTIYQSFSSGMSQEIAIGSKTAMK